MKNLNIAIIGGGPAGFMAAIAATNNSSENLVIDIYDKNSPLKTLLWTGNGRCNLTNNTCDFKELCENYPRGKKFLYSVFSRFGVEKTLGWFGNKGLKTYVQQDNRVFPQSDKASEVQELLLKTARSKGINIIANQEVLKVYKQGQNFIVVINKDSKTYDKVIVATGGDINPENDAGYKIAKSFGHKITDLRPSLAGFITREKWVKEISGVSLKSIKLASFFGGKKVTDFSGDMVFTHKGVSGPLIFKTSAYNAYTGFSDKTPLLLEINFLPEISREKLERELLSEFNKNPNKNILNITNKYIPKSLIETLFNFHKIDGKKKACNITKVERKIILEVLCKTKLHAVSTVPDGEIVTAGGVNLKEINPKTMESKLVEGLYFCGEVLDIDGLTGGFNLQACWSTGYISGISL